VAAYLRDVRSNTFSMHAAPASLIAHAKPKVVK